MQETIAGGRSSTGRDRSSRQQFTTGTTSGRKSRHDGAWGRHRLREEDPFTGEAVRDVSSHIIAHRSRFEFDLNRGSEDAVYQTPQQSWGLEVWQTGTLEAEVLQRSLDLHSEYYHMLGALLDRVARRHKHVLLLDVHSYNHRRRGPETEPTPQEDAPDINIGTFSMPREQWAWLVDPLMEAMGSFDFNGAGSMCAKTSPSRAKENRRVSSTTDMPRGAARSRSSSRSSSWTSGAASFCRGSGRDARVHRPHCLRGPAFARRMTPPASTR